MKLWEYSGKHVRIIADDGQIFEGLVDLYTSANDNPDGVASICIGHIELSESEIKSIELIA